MQPPPGKVGLLLTLLFVMLMLNMEIGSSAKLKLHTHVKLKIAGLALPDGKGSKQCLTKNKECCKSPEKCGETNQGSSCCHGLECIPTGLGLGAKNTCQAKSNGTAKEPEPTMHSCGVDGHQCGKGEGDCDFDSDCQDGLVCGMDNCQGDGFDKIDDCCEDKALVVKPRVRMTNVPKDPKRQIPEVYYNGIWSPICGHWFWDNDNGATLFGKELHGGSYDGTCKITRKRTKLQAQGVMIGKCTDEDLKKGKTIFECSGGHNLSNAGGRYERGCAKGKTVGVEIECQKQQS